MATFSKVANGSIVMSRFVKLDTTADGKVLQCGAGDKIFGVSQAGSRRTPYSSLDDGYAAIAGEDLSITGPPDQCLLELGGTVSPGDRLKADTDGKGVATTTDHDEWGAIALVAGTSGKLINVQVTGANQISA